MAADHVRFMRLALEEAARSRAEGNVAVGSVIVQGDTVVARGRNLVTSTLDPTAHAETVALREAGAALQRVEYVGCALYTTFEPCPMCCGAILVSKVSTLIIGGRYAAGESRWQGYSAERLIELTGRTGELEVVTDVLAQECRDMWHP